MQLLTLALNTATTHTEIALLEGSKILFEKSWLSKRDEAQKILPEIQKALEENSLGFKNLERIFVVQGPGTFSGLRIGVTMANALGFSQNIPIFASSTFELLLHKIPETLRETTASIISAGGTHLAIFFVGSTKPILVELSSLGDFLAKEQNIRYLFADLPENVHGNVDLFLKNTPELQINWLPPQHIQTFGEALKEILASEMQEQQIVAPLYLQKPNITQSKKEVFVGKT